MSEEKYINGVWCLGARGYLACWNGQNIRRETKKEAEIEFRKMHPAWDDTGTKRSGTYDEI